MIKTAAKQTILYVHIQNEKMLKTYAPNLQKKGYHTILVDRVYDAFKIIDITPVNIVVIDMDEDYEATFKFCHHLKSNPETKNVIIIALSGALSRFNIQIIDDTESDRSWLNVDFWKHKPINAKEIYLMVKRELAIIEGIDAIALDSE